MPAESVRWQTLEALKQSTKGKLKYNADWLEKGEDILPGCNEAPSLSPLSGLILKRLSPQPQQKTFSLGLVSRDSSASLCEEIPTPLSSSSLIQGVCDETKPEDKEQDVSIASSPSSPPAISLLSPKATQIAGCILICEEKYRAKTKMELSQRQEEQEHLKALLTRREFEQLKRFEEFMELKQRQEYQSMRDMMDREIKESIGRHEKLKEEQRHKMKILNLRLREAEQQRLREVEIERQRQVEGKERLRNLNTIQEEILGLNQLLEPSGQTKTGSADPDLTSYVTRGNQLCSQVSEVVRSMVEGRFPSVEDMMVVDRALQEMRALVHLMKEEKAKAQERIRKEQEEEEERKKQAEALALQEEQKKVAPSIKEKVQREGLQMRAEDSTLKWFKSLQDSAAQCAQAFQGLNDSKDSQMKKLRMELQKVATIPVSQISSISGSQLREIFNKLDNLLSGRSVLSGGKSISTSQHPKGLEFVSYKLAEKFVKQGEEEVASHYEAAFPIAVVASGVWELHPQVGNLVLAHLHRKCPYAVPYFPPMKKGTSMEEYQKILGYRVDDSGVECHDSFLKRMSGMIRFYAAIIQLRWPYGSKRGVSPHGLNHGWRWLAQMLNMEPLADVTATLLLDFLEVCGHALMMQYQGQFWKLILLMRESYFPRIEAVTSSGQMGSVTRLKHFLETCLRSKQVRLPKGQLTMAFWRS